MKASSIGLSGSMTSGGGDGKGTDKDGGKGEGPGGTNLTNVGKSGSSVGMPGVVALSENDSSTTRSGISAGSVTLTGEGAGEGAQGVLAGVDRSVVTGTDGSGRIDNNFDQRATQTALQVTEQFTKTVVAAAAPMAAKLVGDIGTTKEREANAAAASFYALAKVSKEKGDTEGEARYTAQAEAAQSTAAGWSEDGIYRVALHATAQGAIGALAGGSAGALGSAAGVVGGSAGRQVGEFLAKAQAAGLSKAETEELVNTYQQTMSTLGGAVAGLAAGSASDGTQALANTVQGGTTGVTVDKFNRQLHEKEAKWIKDNAAAFAEKEGISNEEATKRLAQQAAKDTDLLWRGLLPEPVDMEAQAYLKEAAGLTFTNSRGQEQSMFSVQGNQLFAPQDGLHETDKGFYKDYVQVNATYAPLKGVSEEGLKLLQAAGVAASTNPVGVLQGAATGLVDSVTNFVKDPYATIQEKLTSIGSDTKTFAEGMAASIDETSKEQLNSLYGQDVSNAVRLATVLQGAGVAGNVADAIGIGKLPSAVVENIAEAAGKSVVRNEVRTIDGVVPDAAVPSSRVGTGQPNIDSPAPTQAQAAGSNSETTSSRTEQLPVELAKAPEVKPVSPIGAPAGAANNPPTVATAGENAGHVDLSKPAETAASPQVANSGSPVSAPNPVPVTQSVASLFGQTFSGPELGHTVGKQNGVLGEQVGLQFLEERIGATFTPLQNASGHGADGFYIDESTKTEVYCQ